MIIITLLLVFINNLMNTYTKLSESIIPLLANIEITKSNVLNILEKEKIKIDENDLVELLYQYLKYSKDSMPTWYITDKKVMRKKADYKQYLVDQFLCKPIARVYKYYYKSRNDFVMDKTKMDKNCELILFNSRTDENIVIEIEKNNKMKKYDHLVVKEFALLNNKNYHIIPGKSLRYWRYQLDLTPFEKSETPRITKQIIINDDILDETWNDRLTQYNKLCAIKSPEQRSEQWFEQRRSSITASACASIIGKDKYKNKYEFIEDKICPKFQANKYCYHGTKYEQIAKLVYEHMFDVSVREFGLLTHPKHKLIAASPDGICSKYKQDKKSKSNRVGVMVEIKCPVTRPIVISDKIDEVVPPQYYEQIQQQLECCTLNICDFFECSISEYDSYENYIRDSDPEKNYISKTSKLYKGCLIELLPITSFNYKGSEFDTEIYSKSLFIYPKTLQMSNDKYDSWICNRLMKKFEKGYVVHKIKYWRLDIVHCISVPRDNKWISRVLPEFNKVWRYIDMFRNNKNKYEKYDKYKKKLMSQNKYSSVSNIFCSEMIKKAFNNALMIYIDNLYKKK